MIQAPDSSPTEVTAEHLTLTSPTHVHPPKRARGNACSADDAKLQRANFRFADLRGTGLTLKDVTKYSSLADSGVPYCHSYYYSYYYSFLLLLLFEGMTGGYVRGFELLHECGGPCWTAE